VLAVENSKLVVTNVPVPTRDYYFPWAKESAEKLKELRSVNLSIRLLRRIGIAPSGSEHLSQTERDRTAREILQKLFEELKRINRERSSHLVLVYLPTIWELDGRGFPSWTSPEEWTRFLEAHSYLLNVPFINVFSKFRSLPRNDMVNLFIPAEKLPYPFHLNDRGNELVAQVIFEKLMNDSSLACVLLTRSPSNSHKIAVRDRRIACPHH